ncbi:unnamed protein product [Euphydryas editha]|uniref:Uncharacterized protein n=1 Tax=Euphydryas editha TaxID=104508 RepID=A0AAU9V5W0_EUPED|nr:unnamed protein product [Euphydryas editha]
MYVQLLKILYFRMKTKAWLKCFFGYGQCNGQACLNTSLYESDVNEDGTFDPEIPEKLEINIVADENEE